MTIRTTQEEMASRTIETQPYKKRTLFTIQMELTEPQALAMEAMLEYWNSLGSWGSSRYVGFYCDGDGDFKPRARIHSSRELPELTDEQRKIAVVRGSPDDITDRLYDFDPIAWSLHKEA